MDPERYQRAGDLYHRALDLPPERRTAFLEQACGSDADLRSEVESLLAAHAQAGQFIETPHEQANVLLQSILPPSHAEHPWPRPGGDSAAERRVGPHSSSDPAKRMATDADSAVEDRDASLAPGQRLGRYEVVDFLGAGGMGSVYRALDSSLGREV